ncbi:MAG: branched-chain amino acid ABC transporter permease [Ignavibacteriales bacterium]
MKNNPTDHPTLHPTQKMIIGTVLAIVLLGVPSAVNDYWLRVVNSALLYVMMAVGLNVILGYTGMLNLGYAAYYAIGAYTWAILASPKFGLHLNFWLVFLLAGLLSGIAGYLLAIPGLKLRGDYLALVTIGFGESLRIFVNNASFTNAAIGISQIDPMTIGFAKANSISDYYYVLVVLCVLEVFFIGRLEKSRIGNAWMAIREDEDAAEAMGLDTRRLKLLANFIGTIPAGMAGVIFAAMQTYVSPVSFTFTEAVGIVAMVIVGGTGNVYGAALGALLLMILPEPLRGSKFDGARILIYGLLLTAMMLFRPQGFWPRRYRGRRGQRNEQIRTPTAEGCS